MSWAAPVPLTGVRLLLVLFLAAPSASAQAPDASAASEAGALLLVTGAGAAGSALLLGASSATGHITPAVLSPLAAALGAYAAAETVGTNGTVLHALQGAFLGAGLAMLLAVSTDDGTRQLVYFATLPAFGAALNLRLGGPLLYPVPTGAFAPGWSLRVGL